MEVELYKTIVRMIFNYQGLSKDCMKFLKQQFPNISSDTLFSILSQEYQKRMKQNHSKTQYTINKYWGEYCKAVENKDSPGIILRMSEKYDVCPCLVAKLILQKYFEECDDDQQVVHINNYLRNTTLIPDMDLSYEVFLCTIYDNLYSPLSEIIRHSLGQQYEVKLHNEVKKLGLAFRDEEHLRKYGYDKTPDVKLDVPVAIDGLIINWIESKALFGDEESHRDYMQNQYLSYWNRFGSGLVIYWFGYLESIIDHNDKRFIISDHLSKNIVQISSQTM